MFVFLDFWLLSEIENQLFECICCFSLEMRSLYPVRVNRMTSREHSLMTQFTEIMHCCVNKICLLEFQKSRGNTLCSRQVISFQYESNNHNNSNGSVQANARNARKVGFRGVLMTQNVWISAPNSAWNSIGGQSGTQVRILAIQQRDCTCSRLINAQIESFQHPLHHFCHSFGDCSAFCKASNFLAIQAISAGIVETVVSKSHGLMVWATTINGDVFSQWWTDYTSSGPNDKNRCSKQQFVRFTHEKVLSSCSNRSYGEKSSKTWKMSHQLQISTITDAFYAKSMQFAS